MIYIQIKSLLSKQWTNCIASKTTCSSSQVPQDHTIRSIFIILSSYFPHSLSLLQGY